MLVFSCYPKSLADALIIGDLLIFVTVFRLGIQVTTLLVTLSARGDDAIFGMRVILIRDSFGIIKGGKSLE